MIQVRGSKRIVAAQKGIFSNLVLGGKFTPKISSVYRSNFLCIGLRKSGSGLMCTQPFWKDMNMAKRRNFTDQFKAKVALETRRCDRTV